MFEKYPANGSRKRSHEIQLSGLFNISVQESNRKPCSESLEDIVRIPVPPGKDKEALINLFVQIFKNGKKLEWENESEQKLLKALLGYAKNASLEKVLRDGKLTFWDAGTKVFVLIPLNAGSKLSTHVVKSPIKPAEYVEQIRPGYLLAKDNLQGKAADFTMTEGNITVCDLNGIPREAFFENLLLQERVIVIKTIRKGIEERNRILKDRLSMLLKGKSIHYDFDKAETEKYGIKKSSIAAKFKKLFAGLGKYRSEIQVILDEMVDLHHYNKLIKQKFNELYSGIENMGIYDSDDGRAGMDRNYGIRIPERLRRNFKSSEWGLEDFKKLMEAVDRGRITERDIEVVGFDFDGLRTKKDAALQQNRVEDVFQEEIEAEIRAVLGKVLQ
ncbi:MAG: hypothetical protein ABR903_03575 [Thermodesulfovibrionales bacterium]|jgi:hypothetical protein